MGKKSRKIGKEHRKRRTNINQNDKINQNIPAIKNTIIKENG